MATDFSGELESIAERLDAAVAAGNADDVAGPISRMQQAAAAIGGAWSGSPLGYHAHVYYAGLETPPPGAHWSLEWGNYPAVSGSSSGDWREYAHDVVVNEIE